MHQIDYARIAALIEYEKDDFSELVRVAGLSPDSDFRHADLSSVDFGDIDLNGFDFTGASLCNADLSRARGIWGAFFFGADITGAKWPRRKWPVIAIDGTAGSGKATLARRLAARLDLPLLDTGLLYRVVARRVLDAGGDPTDTEVARQAAAAVELEDFARGDLHDEAVSQAASQIAAQRAVREALLPVQRRFAQRPWGAILVGRDIGTAVCPDATHKIFVTASPEVRAERRLAELHRRGVAAAYGAVLQDLRRRDARDQSRAFAPLLPAPDALVLDTTGLDAEAAFAKLEEALRLRNEDVIARALRRLVRQEAGAQEATRVLTRRELEVVRLAARGMRNKEIAQQLNITEGTVKSYMHRIYKKVGVERRTELMFYAQAKHLV